jgi:hypothetical protein
VYAVAEGAASREFVRGRRKGLDGVHEIADGHRSVRWIRPGGARVRNLCRAKRRAGTVCQELLKSVAQVAFQDNLNNAHFPDQRTGDIANF